MSKHLIKELITRLFGPPETVLSSTALNERVHHDASCTCEDCYTPSSNVLGKH